MKVYTVNKSIAPHYSDEEKYQRMLEGTPRAFPMPPILAEFHKRQKYLAAVEARKAVRRKRYLRQHSQSKTKGDA